MTDDDLVVRFWGVRGSHPVPGKLTTRFGGNTSCIEVRCNNQIVILDAGTGIINLGNQLSKEFYGNNKARRGSLKTTLLISHTHTDHVQGIPFFAPAYVSKTELNIYGSKSLSFDLAEILTATMEPQYSPIGFDELRAKINLFNFTENDCLTIGKNSAPQLSRREQAGNNSKKDVQVSLMRSYAHPKVGVFIFKIQVGEKSLVYATDTEGYVGGDTRLIEFAKNTDLLIHDAQYSPKEYTDPNFPRQGFGHSTYEMAANTAIAAGAKQLVLFHHDPAHDDDEIAEFESRAKKIFANTVAGSEGLEIRL